MRLVGGDVVEGDRTVSYQGVVVTHERIEERSGGRLIFHLRRADVERLELTYGARAERPVVQIAFGLVLVAIGVVAILTFWGLLPFGYGLLYSKLVAGFGGIVPAVGVFALVMGVRRGYFLRAALTSGDVRKLCFEEPPTRSGWDAFAERARALGVPITVDPNMPPMA